STFVAHFVCLMREKTPACSEGITYKHVHFSGDMTNAEDIMFLMPKGSGMIVYRLRTRDDKYVYLKSVGHLHYDSSTSKVDHLVCNNQQLEVIILKGYTTKIFFDKLNPHVIGNSLEDLQQSVRSLDISESLNHKVNGAMQLNGESPNHSTESDSSNIDSDELKNPKDDYRNDISDNCSSSDQEAFQENGSSYPGSPDHAANNGFY
ncbi:hypothetical protein CEXT_424551, partial [Caerostris extrusa]